MTVVVTNAWIYNMLGIFIYCGVCNICNMRYMDYVHMDIKHWIQQLVKLDDNSTTISQLVERDIGLKVSLENKTNGDMMTRMMNWNF